VLPSCKSLAALLQEEPPPRSAGPDARRRELAAGTDRPTGEIGSRSCHPGVWVCRLRPCCFELSQPATASHTADSPPTPADYVNPGAAISACPRRQFNRLHRHLLLIFRRCEQVRRWSRKQRATALQRFVLNPCWVVIQTVRKVRTPLHRRQDSPQQSVVIDRNSNDTALQPAWVGSAPSVTRASIDSLRVLDPTVPS